MRQTPSRNVRLRFETLRLRADTSRPRPVASPPIDTDTPADKRLRVELTTESISTTPPEALKPKTIPCISATRDSDPCVNAAAAKCAHGACSACCGNGAEGGVEMCEFHLGKKEKEREKKEAKRSRGKEKRARARGAAQAQNEGGSVKAGEDA